MQHDWMSLEAFFDPITALKRRVGLAGVHSVKLLGPHRSGAMALFRALAANNGSSRVARDASTVADVALSFRLSVQQCAYSPIGFFVHFDDFVEELRGGGGSSNSANSATTAIPIAPLSKESRHGTTITQNSRMGRDDNDEQDELLLLEDGDDIADEWSAEAALQRNIAAVPPPPLLSSHESLFVPLSTGSLETAQSKHALRSRCDERLRRQWEIQTALFTEPGSIVWVTHAAPCRQSLLQQFCAIVEKCWFVVGLEPTLTAPPLPNHLLVVVHDWPSDAPRKAEQDLRDWLWKTESTFDEETGLPSQEAKERNAMRSLLESSFLSVDVIAFPEESALHYVERVEQVSRSRAVGGVLEAWGMSGGRQDAASMRSDLLTRLTRISKLCSTVPLLGDEDAGLIGRVSESNAQWLAERQQQLVQAEFVDYCTARRDRITAEQVREVQHVIETKCRRLAEALFCDAVGDGGEHLLSSTAGTIHNTIESQAQVFLANIQNREEEEAARAAERRQRQSLQQSLLGGTRDPLQRDLWWAAQVQRHVPQRYWFWFTSQGLCTVFVFLSMLTYMLWSNHRSS